MKKSENEQHEPVGFSSSDCVIIIEDRPGGGNHYAPRSSLEKNPRSRARKDSPLARR